MSDFVETVADYVELEGTRLGSDEQLLRAFSRAPRLTLEEELTEYGGGIKKPSIQRQLQKWGLTGKDVTAKKVVRGPLAKAGSKLSAKYRLALRMILLKRRNARVEIKIAGPKRYNSGGSQGSWQRSTADVDANERALIDILKLNAVSLNSQSGVEPPEGSGESGELAALNVLTGYWFETEPVGVKCDGHTVITQPYHDVMEYESGTVFSVRRMSAGRNVA